MNGLRIIIKKDKNQYQSPSFPNGICKIYLKLFETIENQNLEPIPKIYPMDQIL